MTKIAVISDIHSNSFALQSVLDDIAIRDVDNIINLGDSLYGAINPKTTLELLKNDNIISINGNQDRQIYETLDTIDTNPTLAFIIEEIGEDGLLWLKQLPFDYRINDIYFCHATPTNDLIYLLEDVSTGLPRLREEQDIIKLLANEKASLIVCGHTHLPRIVRLSTGQTIVNVGSVGYPAYFDDEPYPHKMENYSPNASYVLIERSNKTNDWDIEFIRLSYDFESSAKLAELHGRDDWAYHLRTGRAIDRSPSAHDQ